MFKRAALLILALLLAGCSQMEGLQVLTGEDTTAGAGAGGGAQDLDLVMADKSGATDPALIQAAYRIEAANTIQDDPLVDIVEIRRDEANSALYVALIYLLPLPSASSPLEQLTVELDNFRRAFESVWQATRAQAQGLDIYRIDLLEVSSITTLDNGPSIAARVAVQVTIPVPDALVYLESERSLTQFQALVVDGKMTYTYSPGLTVQPYNGQPNHPLIFDPRSAGREGGI